MQIICKISITMKERNKIEKSFENTADLALVFAFVIFQRYIIQFTFACLTGFPVEKNLQTNYFF